MFIITEVFAEGPKIGVQYTRDTWEKAVDIAVRMAVENSDDAPHIIRNEIEETCSYVGNDGEWAVCIGQPD